MSRYSAWVRRRAAIPLWAPALVAWAGVMALVNPATADSGLRVVVDPSAVTLLDGDQPVLQYRHKAVPYKPYVRELFTPNGINVLRDAPHDHLHHHALMFAVKVNGVNFWEETDRAGRQAHRSIDDVKSASRDGSAVAAFTERLAWLSPDGKQLLHEQRTIDVHGGQDIQHEGATLVTWTTHLELAAGQSEATLTGSHYHGLGMRFAASMDRTGTFRNAAGAEGELFRGEERLVQANWCAYTAEVDGKPVTVAMFDHPQNVRPVTWFTMKSPFAYLSATLRYHEQPLKLERGKTLDLYYGAAVWDGRVDSARIEQVYRHWLQNTQRPSTTRSDE